MAKPKLKKTVSKKKSHSPSSKNDNSMQPSSKNDNSMQPSKKVVLVLPVPPIPVLAPVSTSSSMRVFRQEVNENEVVRKRFQVIQSNGEKTVKTEGVSNEKNASKFHILRTIRNHHGTEEKKFVISEKDIMKLLKEGNRLGDYNKMVAKSTPKKTFSKSKSKSKVKVKK